VPVPRPAPRKRTQNAKRALYRDLIAEAAERVFAERGFESSKVQDVADDAGIALGTLYRCFSGKAEILRAVHEGRSRELLARCEATLRAGASPLRALLDYVSSYLEYLLAHPDYLRMHLDESSAWGFGTRFESGVQNDAWRRAHDIEVDMLREGTRAGLFVERDPSLLVRMAASIQQVQLAGWLEAGGEIAPETLLTRMREDLVRTVCRPAVAAWLEDGGAKEATAKP
jgi:AcrR family transcriptional regulator